MNRTKKVFINILLLLVLITGSFIGGFYHRHIKAAEEKVTLVEEHQKEIGELMQQIPVRQSAIVLSKRLEAGAEITEADLMFVQYDKDFIPEGAIATKEDVLGKELKIDTAANTIITEDDVYEKNILSAAHREKQLSFVKLPEKLSAGDYVDIRILFPTGQDYIVLSKKRIDDLKKLIDANNMITKQTIWSILDEEELVRMGSAVVDAYVNGGEIYAIEYVEPFLQEAAKVTYPKNLNVLALISANAQIVNTATYDLEVRLRNELNNSLVKYLNDSQTITKIVETVPAVEPAPVVEETLEAPVNEETPVTPTNEEPGAFN